MPRRDVLEEQTERGVLRRYRLSKRGIRLLTEKIEGQLQRRTARSQALSPTTQVLACLGVLATGSFQAVIGDSLGISAASVSRSVHNVVGAILESRDPALSIRFPSTPVEVRAVKGGFHLIDSFPNAPHREENLYVCRKGYHALNVLNALR
ncbi:putative nuclease HARBI1 [Lingula anatina]|uniref:Nuclease HARBI1 n=1 Tax=Lingula anatina TaxID=7574 RepID=A0A1S3H2H5_LINAN|nr:putative nuclease HARBI1 [Lingula anatina]|eukprot:XP_013379344.1 putative nuclease HARBI1 [Lingula anatina]